MWEQLHASNLLYNVEIESRTDQYSHLMKLYRGRRHDVFDLLLHSPHGESFSANVGGQRVAAVGLCVLWFVAATFLKAGLAAQMASGRRRVVV